jgi:hypothetical protein
MIRIRHIAIAAAALAAAGCQSKGDWPKPATQTSAVAVARVGGRLKLYVPLQNGAGPGQIAVLDAGRDGGGGGAALPARVGTVDLSRGTGDTDFASLVAGDETGLLAAGVTFPKVWFIDPATDKVTDVLTLPASYGTSSFSGRTPFITGVIVDSERRRAYLGVYNGFAVVDLDRRAIVDVILAPPSESFGYDPARRRLIAPFYNCTLATPGTSGQVFPCDTVKAADGTTTITDGLSLVDLDARAVYTFHDASAANPAAPLGLVPDSAAVDPASGLVVVPAEGPGVHVKLDLAHATLDAPSKSFTAPPASTVDSAPFTGVAFTEDGGFAMAVEESTDQVAVYDRGAGALQRGRLPAPPGAAEWISGADPHPITAAVHGGRSYGFVVSSDHAWVARIDLATYWGLAHGGADLTGAEMAPALTLLDATTSY